MDQQPYVIVVDDDPNVLHLLQVVFADLGLKPICCASADDCLNQLRTNDVKLVLSDIVMPEMDGVELLRRILAVRPDTNVIMMTGMSDIEVAKRCLAMGAKDFITKPLDLEYLRTSAFAEMVKFL